MLLIVLTDSILSLPEDGTWLTAICIEVVKREPPVVDGLSNSLRGEELSGPSGSMTKPEGGGMTLNGSSPCNTMFRVEKSTGAYTMSDPHASVQLSWRNITLLWLRFDPCT